MRMHRALLVLGLALWSLGANAQIQTGNLYGRVLDERVSPLAGATLTLKGDGAPQVQTTDAQGRIRFSGLAPGKYTLEVELQGFSTVEYPNIEIGVGRDTVLEITLTAPGEGRTPAPRNPGTTLSGTPGVLNDPMRSGIESSQPAQYVGPDMAAASTPQPRDFGAFADVLVTTGSDDVAKATGGIVLEAMTQRGTNEWRGSGRFAFLDHRLQSTGRAPFQRADHLILLRDVGAEIGGPILENRFWIWGSYARRDADLRTTPGPASPEGARASSDITTVHLKLNAQVLAGNSATLFAMDNDLARTGRGAGPTRPQETTWNQSSLGSTPTGFKIEDTHIFSPRLYATGFYAAVDNGFRLVPQDGSGRLAHLDGSSVWHDTFLYYGTKRPQEQLRGDVSAFVTKGSLSHELKLGASSQRVDEGSYSAWPNGGVVYDGPSYFGLSGDVLALSRPALLSVRQKQTSLYVQDTLSKGRLTVNAGLRFDHQKAENRGGGVPANPLRPDLLPAVDNGGGNRPPNWGSLVPRVGVTYALGQERRTLFHGSYSLFADRMSAVVASWLDPLALQSYIGLAGAAPLFFSSNVDPRNGRLLVSNAVDPGLRPPRTEEVLLGVEHTLLPGFVIGLRLTHRRLSGLLEQELLVFDDEDPYCSACLGSVGRPHRRADYEARSLTAPLPERQGYLTYYQLRPGLSTRLGTQLHNGEREQRYRGAALTFDKHLSGRWMVRGNFTWSDWEWSRVPDDEVEDPTLTVPGRIPRRGTPEGISVIQGPENPDLDEGAYLQSNWSYNLNGLYQIAPGRPWGFDVAVNLNGRQGSPIPYYVLVTLPENMQRERIRVLATDGRYRFRLADLHTADLRLEKEIELGDFGLTVGADVFNITNETTVLRRQPRLGIATSGQALETLNPRVFQIGARLSFR